MEINFIQQIRRFDELSAGILNPNAIAIYYHLLNVNNRCGWKEWFTESDLWICRFVGIKRHETILAAINLLKQKGFIDFERGTKRNIPTKYRIIVLNNSTERSTEHSTKHSTEHSTKHSTERSTEHSDNPKHKTKTKTETETETIDTRTRASVTPPTLEEINEYCLLKNLDVEAKQFYDYFTEGNWTDSKGNKVKNWKQKLLTWNRYATPKKDKTSVQSSSLDAADRVIDFFESLEDGNA